MTKEECIKLIEQYKQRPGFCFLIFFRSPVTDMVERRVIWADDYAEGIQWLQDKMLFYKEKDIPFAAYAAGGFVDCEGYIFK